MLFVISEACLSTKKLDDLNQLMISVTRHAAEATSLNVETMFSGMGHIGEIQNQTRDYASASTLPGVKVICEVGFNAGHSATVFLSSNPEARYLTFDFGDLRWAAAQRDYVNTMFPGRFFYVLGDSHKTIKEYHLKNPHEKCDLWSIDGDHSSGASIDFEAAREMSWPGAYVLADDHTNSFPAIKHLWHQQQMEDKLSSIYCHHENKKYDGHERGWCLGRWLPLNTSSPRYLINRNELIRKFNRLRNRDCSNDDNSNVDVKKLPILKDCKFLVYTTLSYDKSFNTLARLLVKSVYANAKKYPSRCNISILIMTDKKNLEDLDDLRDHYGVTFYLFPISEIRDLSFMQKLQIFKVPGVRSFEAVLFIDADTLVNLYGFDSIFLKVFSDPDKLHVFSEPRASFEAYFWSLGNARFNESELRELASNGIVPFNSGVFMFVPNSAMLLQFERLSYFIASYKGDYFLDQSFVNYWFPRQRLVTYTIDEKIYTFPFFNDSHVYHTLIHFAGGGIGAKLPRMTEYFNKHMKWTQQYTD